MQQAKVKIKSSQGKATLVGHSEQFLTTKFSKIRVKPSLDLVVEVFAYIKAFHTINTKVGVILGTTDNEVARYVNKILDTDLIRVCNYYSADEFAIVDRPMRYEDSPNQFLIKPYHFINANSKLGSWDFFDILKGRLIHIKRHTNTSNRQFIFNYDRVKHDVLTEDELTRCINIVDRLSSSTPSVCIDVRFSEDFYNDVKAAYSMVDTTVSLSRVLRNTSFDCICLFKEISQRWSSLEGLYPWIHITDSVRIPVRPHYFIGNTYRETNYIRGAFLEYLVNSGQLQELLK